MGLHLAVPLSEMGVHLVNEELGHVRVVVKCRNCGKQHVTPHETRDKKYVAAIIGNK